MSNTNNTESTDYTPVAHEVDQSSTFTVKVGGEFIAALHEVPPDQKWHIVPSDNFELVDESKKTYSGDQLREFTFRVHNTGGKISFTLNTVAGVLKTAAFTVTTA